MSEYSGKVAIITGASQGIGKEIALGFARAGAKVVVADIDYDLAIGVQAEIEGFGGTAVAVKTDVSSVASIKEMVQTSTEAYGNEIDYLVCVAGIARQQDFFDTSEDVWDMVMDINLKGSFFCAKEVGAVMANKGKGKIVLVGSTSSFVTSTKPMVAYDISKGGVRSMTAVLAQWMGPLGINVNAIAPAVTKTPLVDKIFGEDYWTGDWIRHRYPLGRIALPQDHLDATLFLCSEEASYIAGHTIVIDGGCLLAYRRKSQPPASRQQG